MTAPALMFAIVAATLGFLASSAGGAAAGNRADGDLFSLTNQDRASNGVGAVQGHSKLDGIGENLPYSGCGFVVLGRSQDMINRNYFGHPIAGCGKLVFAMMTANGIHYLAAGENIGWASGTVDASASATYINGQFMNSPEHRTNILNPKYTHLGVGTAQSNAWTGAGGSYSDVWMFSEEFAALGSAPTAAPAVPAPTPLPPRNQPAPPAPLVPPTVTEQPTPGVPPVPPAITEHPTAAATPVPSRTGTPPPPPGESNGYSAPTVDHNPGLLSDSVEAVLEAYLVD